MKERIQNLIERAITEIEQSEQIDTNKLTHLVTAYNKLQTEKENNKNYGDVIIVDNIGTDPPKES